jgi:small subunit ribosomal protein S1
VVRLQPFGAFVDIGGLDGLVHVSELKHGRVTDPSQVVQVGQTLRVRVIGIENIGADKGERISLSARALLNDPWRAAGTELQVGSTVTGRVLRLMNYGAFVEVLPGVEGLLHISEIGEGRIRHPSEAVAEGAPVEVRVLEFDPERRRLSLSMRPPGSAPAAAEPREALSSGKLQVGMSIEGSVSSVKQYGVFVRIQSPVSGVDGLLPAEETGQPRGTDLNQVLPVGSAVRAEVLRIDAMGRIRLTQRPASERVASERSGVERSGGDRSGGERPTGRGREREGGGREREGGREGRDRDFSRGGRERGFPGRGPRAEEDIDTRESRRRQRRGPHPAGGPDEARDGEAGEDERREAKATSSGLGIMAKAFRRVLEGS